MTIRTETWRCVARASILAALLVTSGCTRVAKYQRSRLAHPSMVQAEAAGPGEQHVRAVLEGAVGGSLEASGGCGCN